MDTRTNGPEVTILSYGAGQDSTALLHLYINDASFRAKYAPNRFIVVMSGTGAEHPDTDAYVETVKVLCADSGIEFHHIAPSDGYHTGGWTRGLIGQWEKNSTIGSASYPASCSSALKIEPIWKFVEKWIETNYGYAARRKRGISEFVRDFGKIRCILGIAKGEEKRAGGSKQTKFDFVEEKSTEKVWFRDCVDRSYPLIDLGLDRAGCQALIQSYGSQASSPSFGTKVPSPSNCWACPYKSRQEVLWTARFLPIHFEKWLSLEDTKRTKWEGATKDDGTLIPNHGVKGKTTLREYYAEAVARYGHWTDEQLETYRQSHGHCNNSKF